MTDQLPEHPDETSDPGSGTGAGTDPAAVAPPATTPLVPGEYRLAAAPIALNADAPRTALTVRNRGDRPVQVGSHYHFAEANPALDFDRNAAWGLRLDIPAGTAVRFEPGLPREVSLVPIGGRRIVTGLRGLSGAREGGALDG